jgi:hypothetical protein
MADITKLKNEYEQTTKNRERGPKREDGAGSGGRGAQMALGCKERDTGKTNARSFSRLCWGSDGEAVRDLTGTGKSGERVETSKDEDSREQVALALQHGVEAGRKR